MVKNLPASAGDKRETGPIPGSRRSPGGGPGAHSSILTWRIPWTEDLAGYGPLGRRVGHTHIYSFIALGPKVQN